MKSPTSFLIRSVHVFDGVKSIQNADVLVENGQIASLDFSLQPGWTDSLEVVDGSGHTLFPGLIDAHTHIFGIEDLQTALVFGVTTEMDMGADYMLLSVAVVVIGGTLVSGGRPSVTGTWSAACFLFLINALLNASGAGAGLRAIVYGALIIGVTAIATGPADARS